ncbi:MAG: hypothetical protein KAT39_03005 [Alphaproteobacteria bacterium]|nr:hypothetical protein [Alphaproteobacteria bacterium]
MTRFDGQVYGALYAYVEASRPFAELIEEVQGMRRVQCLGKFDIATVPTEPLPGGSPISVDRYFCELATGVIVSMSVITQSDEDSLLVVLCCTALHTAGGAVLHGAPYDSGEAVALAALQIQAHLRAVAMVKQN